MGLHLAEGEDNRKTNWLLSPLARFIYVLVGTGMVLRGAWLENYWILWGGVVIALPWALIGMSWVLTDSPAMKAALAEEAANAIDAPDPWAFWLDDWAPTSQDYRIQFSSQYRGGIADLAPTSRGNIWLVQMTPRGLSIGEGVVEGLIGKASNFPTGGVRHWRSAPWSEIEHVTFENTSVNRVNKGAVAFWGVLAVGSKIGQSGLHVSYKDGTEIFLVADGTVFDWKAKISSLQTAAPGTADIFEFASPD